MIIETRYRDIPWEEARRCQSNALNCDEKQWNELFRGKSVQIIVPGTDRQPTHVICKGPFFVRVDGRFNVCPHIAEIGD